MKTIYLIRHAKASKKKEKSSDFKRTLVKRGQEEAKLMARQIKRERIIPELIISSPASRSLETAHIYAKTLGYPVKKIILNETLYEDMSEEALLFIVRNQDDKYESLMMFGHDPSFSNFTNYLLKNFKQNIPKSGIVGISFSSEKWKDVSKGTGNLEFFYFPKQEEKTYKKIRIELEKEIINQVINIFSSKDPISAKKTDKLVRSTSKTLAKEFIKIMKSTKEKEANKESEKLKKNEKKDIQKNTNEKESSPQKKDKVKSSGKIKQKEPHA